jgi:negative regulator of sigma E activity
MSANVGAPVPSFATSCQRVCVPRWKPMPMQLMAAASASVVASAAVEPYRPKKSAKSV